MLEITIEFHCWLFGYLAKECLIYQSSNTFYRQSTTLLQIACFKRMLYSDFVTKNQSRLTFLHLKQTIMPVAPVLYLNEFRSFKQCTINDNVWICEHVNGFSEWVKDFVAIILMLRNKCEWGTQTNNFKTHITCATIGDLNANNVQWKFTFWWVRMSKCHLPQPFTI